MSRRTLTIVPPPEAPADGALGAAFVAYFPSGAPAGLAEPSAAAAAPQFSVFRRHLPQAPPTARPQYMLHGRTVRSTSAF